MQGCFSLFILNLAFVVSFKTTVDFETNDCGKEFKVTNYDEFNIIAKPVFSPIGGPDHCVVRFTSDDTFRIYVQDFHVNDCTVKLLFYDNEPSQTREKYLLGCPPHDPPENRILTTTTGNLIIRLDKASGTTFSYRFTLTLTTGTNTGSTSLGASGSGGGISTGALIGIIVGVIVFFIIIAVFVFYFVCKQVREKKEEEIRRYEAANPSVFTTASSRNFDRNAHASSKGSASGSHRVEFSGISNDRKSRGSYRSQSGSMKGRSHGHVNHAYARSVDETASNPSTRFAESTKSYNTSVKSQDSERRSIRMKEWSNDKNTVRSSRKSGHYNDSDDFDDTSFTDARSSVRFNITDSDEALEPKNKPFSKDKSKSKMTESKNDKTSVHKNDVKSKAEKERQNLERKEGGKEHTLKSNGRTDTQPNARHNISNQTEKQQNIDKAEDSENKLRRQDQGRESKRLNLRNDSKNDDKRQYESDRERKNSRKSDARYLDYSSDDYERPGRGRSTLESRRSTRDKYSSHYRDDRRRYYDDIDGPRKENDGGQRRRTNSESRRNTHERHSSQRYSTYDDTGRYRTNDSRNRYIDSSRSSSSHVTDSSFRRHYDDYDSDGGRDRRRSSGRHRTRSESASRRSRRNYDDYDSDHRSGTRRTDSIRSRSDRRDRYDRRRDDEDRRRYERPSRDDHRRYDDDLPRMSRDDYKRRSGRSKSHSDDYRHSRRSQVYRQ